MMIDYNKRNFYVGIIGVIVAICGIIVSYLLTQEAKPDVNSGIQAFPKLPNRPSEEYGKDSAETTITPLIPKPQKSSANNNNITKPTDTRKARYGNKHVSLSIGKYSSSDVLKIVDNVGNEIPLPKYSINGYISIIVPVSCKQVTVYYKNNDHEKHDTN
jgi:hypothetical protein